MKHGFRELRWVAIALWAPIACFGAARASIAQEAGAAEAPASEAPLKPSRSGDPAVRALMEAKLATPAELLRAADTLIDLGAMLEADSLVKRLAAEKLDDAALSALAEQFGSAIFLKLALTADVQPAGKQFADAVMAAADRQARDPKRLAALIGQLKDANPAVRRAAIVRLRSGREDAIKLLVSVLGDDSRAAEHPAVRQALAHFGTEAVEPLKAVARSATAPLAAQAIRVLGSLDQAEVAVDLFAAGLLADGDPQVRAAARESLKALIGRVPDVDESVATLERFARSYYDGRRKLDGDLEGQVASWRWNSQTSELTSERVSAHVAALEIARDLAQDASRLAPRSRAVQRLYLGALAEAASYRAGFGGPLPEGPGTALEILAAQESNVIEALLEESVAGEHTAAATVAAGLLGRAGEAELLYRRSPLPSALIQAVRHPDRRLRMAAIDAVLGLKPSKPFPGSSFVVDALGYLAGSFGAPKALAADARPLEAELQAGLLAAIGYDVEAATNDRAALAEAIASPDFEVALIDFSLAAPVSGQLLEQFRRDNRTARLPIGIVASSDDLDRAERLAQRTPLTAVVIRTQDPDRLRFQIDLLLGKLGRSAVSIDERRGQAARAVAWLAQMSAAPRGLYNLRRIETSLANAAWDPELGPQAAEILATLGTADSQKTLVNLASFAAQPLELRQAAAKAFAASVADYGALLTTGEIQQQYDRYNQSETQDQATQKVLASILDVVEARAVADQAD